MAERSTPPPWLSLRKQISQGPSRGHQLHGAVAMSQEFSDKNYGGQAASCGAAPLLNTSTLALHLKGAESGVLHLRKRVCVT